MGLLVLKYDCPIPAVPADACMDSPASKFRHGSTCAPYLVMDEKHLPVPPLRGAFALLGCAIHSKKIHTWYCRKEKIGSDFFLARTPSILKPTLPPTSHLGRFTSPPYGRSSCDLTITGIVSCSVAGAFCAVRICLCIAFFPIVP